MSELSLDQLIDNLEASTADESIEKQASEQVTEEVSVADQLETALEKSASETETEVTLEKTASEVGEALANEVAEMFTKQANEIKEQSDALAQEQSNETERNPEGTINEVRDQIVAQGAAKGAVSPDGVTDKVVGSKEDDKKPEIKNEVAPKSDLEKAASIQELVEGGMSLEDAVSQINGQEQDLVKQAAINHLVANGIDAEKAAELVDTEMNS